MLAVSGVLASMWGPGMDKGRDVRTWVGVSRACPDLLYPVLLSLSGWAGEGVVEGRKECYLLCQNHSAS